MTAIMTSHKIISTSPNKDQFNVSHKIIFTGHASNCDPGRDSYCDQSRYYPD